MSLYQLSGHINVEVMPEQWSNSLNSDQTALQLLVDDSGGARWDRKEFPESNLHVYGRDDI